MSCNNLYFRKLHGCIEITIDTLGNLNLKDYDAMCWLERKYYNTEKISRKGMKYKRKNIRQKAKNNIEGWKRLYAVFIKIREAVFICN